MENEQPTYEELIKINAEQQQQQINLQAQQIAMLKYELEQLKKSIVGPRSERFIPTQDGQSRLLTKKLLQMKWHTQLLKEI